MGLSTVASAASFDVTANTNQLDLSEELAEIIRPDNTIMISRIGVDGFVGKQTTKRWNEDSLNPNSATAEDSADGVLTDSDDDTSLDVTSGEEGRFKVGTIFKDKAQGKSEVMQVTAIDSNVLTITRSYGSTSAEDHEQNFDIHIIAHLKQESWEPGDEDWTKERSGVYNFMQIFGRGLNISHTRQAIDHTAIADEFAHQVAYRLKEISRELDSSVINSIRSASAGSDTVYRSMAGLIEWASQDDGNTNSSEEDFDEGVVNTMVKQIFDDGGEPNFILMGGAKKQTFSTFDQAYRRMAFDSRTAGYVVEQFMSDLGFVLDAIVDPWIPDDIVIVGDLAKFKIGPLQNDKMRVEDLAKTGRLLKAMVTGQYTNECRNAIEAFAIHSNLN